MNSSLISGKSRSGSRQAGLSIVELMVSLVISAAVIAGSVQVMVSSKRNYLDQDEIGFIQNNIRYAMDLIARDVRMAGYLGCAARGTVEIANSIDDDANGFISTHGLQGFDGDTSTAGFPVDFRADATVGTDSFLIRRASDTTELDVDSHNANAATIKLWDEHSYAQGTTLMIADASCRSVGLFQVSGPNGLPSNNLNHNTGNNTKNCTKIIKGNFICDPGCNPTSCGGASAASGSYGPGSKVMEFISHAYYIGESDVIPGMSALKRQALKVNGSPATIMEEVALGVVDMQVLYGTDINGNGAVDIFRTAAQMDIDSNGVINYLDWEKVMSLKIELVFQSQAPVLPESRSVTLAGKTYNDRFMRQLVNTTIKIRNRG